MKYIADNTMLLMIEPGHISSDYFDCSAVQLNRVTTLTPLNIHPSVSHAAVSWTIGERLTIPDDINLLTLARNCC